MAYSEVDVSETAHAIKVTARGGSRRQRGAATGAAVRGRAVTLYFRTYSESYGFQSATYSTYRKDA